MATHGVGSLLVRLRNALEQGYRLAEGSAHRQLAVKRAHQGLAKTDRRLLQRQVAESLQTLGAGRARGRLLEQVEQLSGLSHRLSLLHQVQEQLTALAIGAQTVGHQVEARLPLVGARRAPQTGEVGHRLLGGHRLADQRPQGPGHRGSTTSHVGRVIVVAIGIDQVGIGLQALGQGQLGLPRFERLQHLPRLAHRDASLQQGAHGLEGRRATAQMVASVDSQGGQIDLRAGGSGGDQAL